MTTPFPLIEISGAPFERGKQYGKKASDRIYKGIEHYTKQIQRLSLKRVDLEAVVRDYLPVMERFDSDHVTELQGIAQGADVSFEDIVLLNARTEILKLAANPALRKTLIEDANDLDGCTGVIALPSSTKDGALLHAQNWDWKMECAETAVVLRVRRDNGPDILTFTEAGALARSGMNDAGISLTANYLESSIDYQKIGVPLPLIRRKILETEHYALAIHTTYLTAKSGSNNIMLAIAGGIGMNFECAPGETFVVPAHNGLQVHANHWQSPIALGKFMDVGIATTPDSLYRDMRVRELLERKLGQIEVETIKTALLDDFASPWSVCRPPRLNLASNLSATVATVIMEPAKRRMNIAPLPALGATFTEYSLTE